MNGKRSSGRGSAMKGAQCMPRFRSGRGAAATPISLLERFREVVFRLIMLSALSKGARAHAARRAQADAPARAHLQDSYRSEAVEDCIEFFRQSAGSAEEAKSYSVSEEGVGVALSSALPIM